MFVIRNNVIQSDEGFSVELLGYRGLLYTEGSKTLKIDSEILYGPSDLVLYKDSIKFWKPPYDNEIIDEGKREAIIENVRRAFRFRGYEIAVL